MGSHFASRVSSSILTAAGIPESITFSIDEYVKSAAGLGNDKDRLKSLRRKIIRSHSFAPLFNTEQTVRFIESAYEIMWDRYCKGLTPEKIVIEKSVIHNSQDLSGCTAKSEETVADQL